ncbi:MAG: amidase family protein, partial [Caldilineaceae bacterium]
MRSHLLIALLAGLLLAACTPIAPVAPIPPPPPEAEATAGATEAATEPATCPERTFPIPEPDYTAKRPLDLSAFEAALAEFTPERAAELDTLLAGRDIIGVQELLYDGATTSVELVTYYVDRIQRYDIGRLNSVLELNPQALAEAAEADAKRDQDVGLTDMLGLPVLLKDNIATAGMHTTAGAYALKDWMPERDAFLVQRLREDGAIILGKTNLSEWANYMDRCMPSGFSALGGQTRNPYGPYETYGSSSGSGAAAGAKFATVTVGSETSGSLIQPARVHSVVALRPSLGLISRDYVVPLAPALDTPGPMGRSVTDIVLLLNTIAGVDANDPKTADAAALDGIDFGTYLSRDEARKVRVGVVGVDSLIAQFGPAFAGPLERMLGRAPTEEEIAGAVSQLVLPSLGALPQEAIAGLSAQGIEFVEISEAAVPPGIDTAWPLVTAGFKF